MTGQSSPSSANALVEQQMVAVSRLQTEKVQANGIKIDKVTIYEA